MSSAKTNRVKTPLLSLLGSGDRRVPMSQAIDYHRIISAPHRGLRNRLLIYPQAQHSLIDSVAIEHSVHSFISFRCTAYSTNVVLMI
jgi:dipeptidyl aminopeptidase/acylaminoacyl peptidase